MTDTSATQMVALLSTQEDAIAALYAAFGKVLPRMKPFWDDLVIQEKAHGDVLRQLGKLCESENARLDASKFHVAAVQTNIDRIRKRTSDVLAGGTTAIRALAFAADIENSLIEKEWFQIIQSEIPAIKKELEAIEDHTRQHLTLVEERLEQTRAEEETP